MSDRRHIPSLEDPKVRPPRTDLVRVGLLGLNAWLVAYLLPSLHVGAGSAAVVVLAALPLAALVIGLFGLGERPELARWTLLAVYPTALGALVAARSELVEREAYDAVALSLAAASLLAYVAAAAGAVSRPLGPKPATAHPLSAKEPVVEPLARRWLRRALLVSAAAGGFAIAVLAPSLGDRRSRAEAWGEAASDGGVLTAVVAAVFAALAVGAVIGPSLRAERTRRRSERRTRRRLTMALVVAAACGVAWLALRHFDRALGG